MPRIEFCKMTGAGNDFVVVDNRSDIIRKRGRAARFLCNRRWGIGADGLLLLESSQKAAYKMMYYNADGSYGGMCGNGGRCIARFATDRGIAPAAHQFEALNHIYAVQVQDDSVELTMKNPRSIRLNIVLRKDKKLLRCHFIDTGAPHLVIFLHELSPKSATLDDINIGELGRWLRFHKRFSPAGTNANFVQLTASNVLKIRTYERGVEDETLACGTGSVAAAVVAHLLGHADPPVSVLPASRQPLVVRLDRNGNRFRNVRLLGPAETVFTGSIEADL
jgi:diaminopimelate epimerase